MRWAVLALVLAFVPAAALAQLGQQQDSRLYLDVQTAAVDAYPDNETAVPGEVEVRTLYPEPAGGIPVTYEAEGAPRWLRVEIVPPHAVLNPQASGSGAAATASFSLRFTLVEELRQPTFVKILLRAYTNETTFTRGSEAEMELIVRGVPPERAWNGSRPAPTAQPTAAPTSAPSQPPTPPTMAPTSTGPQTPAELTAAEPTGGGGGSDTPDLELQSISESFESLDLLLPLAGAGLGAWAGAKLRRRFEKP